MPRGQANPWHDTKLSGKTAPATIDVNGDGLEDLVVGSADGELRYWENSYSAVDDTVAFTRILGKSPFRGFDVGSNSQPAAMHVDDDGKMDLVIGDKMGQIAYLQNMGQTASGVSFIQRTGSHNPLDSIDIGVNSAPFAMRIDAALLPLN